jgi:ferritin-like metal-binding protein YciE
MDMNEEKISALSDSQLSDFFIDQVNEIFHAEKRIFIAWPRFENAAQVPSLKESFEQYYQQLQKQIIRLEGIFTILDIKPDERNPEAIEGLLKETDAIIDKTTEGSHTRDAAIVVAIQKIGHYKIATYGSLQQLASTLGMEDISNLLGQSLQEEKNSDLLLSGIADKKINWLAEIETKP